MSKICLLEEPKTSLNNYKKISMYLALGITCIWKCHNCCNAHYKNNQEYLITDTETIIEEYIANPFVDALVISGLEPFDNFEQVYSMIEAFRENINDDIVIFSGYIRDEVHELVNSLYMFDNIIFKFGRYKPDLEPKHNELLGITLASSNQYSFSPAITSYKN